MLNIQSRLDRLQEIQQTKESLDIEFDNIRAELRRFFWDAFHTAWVKAFPHQKFDAIPFEKGIYFYRVYTFDPTLGRDRVHHLLEDGGWGQPDPDDEQEYGVPVDGPFPYVDLARFIEEFEKSIPCAQVCMFPLKVRKGVDGDGIRSLSEARFLYPQKEVLLVSSGQKWHVGWDIPDHYLIITVDGVKEVWWSSDGHGGPMTHRAIEGTPEWGRFKDFLGESEHA